MMMALEMVCEAYVGLMVGRKMTVVVMIEMEMMVVADEVMTERIEESLQRQALCFQHLAMTVTSDVPFLECWKETAWLSFIMH